MKTRTKEPILICMVTVLLLLCCFPVLSKAGEQSDPLVFSTFEELRDYCVKATEASLVCEEPDLVISENLEIPSGISVTFQNFTVPEGVTLTIGEDAELKTYALDVDGLLINRGTVFQGTLSEITEEQDTMIMAGVSGHISNEGVMTLTDVFGKSNIDGIWKNYTMIEIVDFKKKLDLLVNGPETQSETETTLQSETVPQSEPSKDLRTRVLEVFDVLEIYLPRFLFISIPLLFVVLMVKSTIDSKKHKKTPGRSSSISKIEHKGAVTRSNPTSHESTIAPHITDEDDYFLRERRNWVSQLDDMLKSGIIDKKEHDELKKQFGQEGS